MNLLINGSLLSGFDDNEESRNYLVGQGFLIGDIEAAFKIEQWNIVREKRDRLMFESDWTQVTDSQLSAEKKSEFSAYRQLLREIPQTYSSPDDVVWPPKPVLK